MTATLVLGQYARSATRPGQCLLLVGAPYKQSYHIFAKLSALEEEIIFGKKLVSDAVFQFVHPDLQKFSEEHGVICADWINGDTSGLRQTRTAIFEQRSVGRGRTYFYVRPGLIKDDLIQNQSKEHYLNVIYVAGVLIQKGLKVSVNHFNDADIVCEFPSGPCAFECQTAGNNDRTRLMRKRENYENRYCRLIFFGNLEAVDEMKKALESDDIIVSRGTALENQINKLMSEKLELESPIPPV